MAMTSKNRNAALDIKFSLAHIGSFLSERNPMILWESLVELISEVPDFKSHLEIKLIGSVSQEVLETISQFGLDSYLNNLGYVSHGEAIAHQRRSQVLLLIEIDSEDTKSIIRVNYLSIWFQTDPSLELDLRTLISLKL
jgi:hypothetical protein